MTAFFAPKPPLSGTRPRPLAPRLRDFIEHTGGFTLHQNTGEPLCEGVSVCAAPDLALCFPLDEWDDETVENWVVDRMGERTGDDVHLGGWLDPLSGYVWLDLVRVFPPHHRRVAINTGQRFRQLAVFDLGCSTVLEVTGADPNGSNPSRAKRSEAGP